MKRIITIATVLFFGLMTVLTFSARSIHNSNLPHVETIDISKQDFVCVFYDEQGVEYSTLRRAIGIPNEALSNDIFIAVPKEVYGETRYFACKVEPMYYEDYFSDYYTAVLVGLSAGDRLVVYDGVLTDGCEIVVKE